MDDTGPEAADGAAPRGTLATQTIAMPADTNPSGDIFGGWLLSQMDLAGAVVAWERARGRVATVAIDSMTFHRPVFVGDVVSCHAEIVRIGRTSMAIRVEAWSHHRGHGERHRVTQGVFTYVAIGEDRKPRPIDDAAG
ncbi:MAG: acyl-CoA thioesterase [Alphaproteobacteria bacterium]